MDRIENELRQAAKICLEPVDVSDAMRMRIQRARREEKRSNTNPKAPRLVAGLSMGLVAAVVLAFFAPRGLQNRQYEQAMMKADWDGGAWNSEEEAAVIMESMKQEAAGVFSEAANETKQGPLDGLVLTGMEMIHATPYGREGTWKYTYQDTDKKRKLFVFTHMNEETMDQIESWENVDLLEQYPARFAERDGGAMLSWTLAKENYDLVLQTGSKEESRMQVIQIGEAISEYLIQHEQAED